MMLMQRSRYAAGRFMASGLMCVALAGCSESESDSEILLVLNDRQVEAAAVPIHGRWRTLRSSRIDPTLSDEQRQEIMRLEAIGYLSGSTEASSRTGVTIYDVKRAQPGLNFYTSGHAPEAVLMDMEGRVLHRWRADVLSVWPDYPKPWLHSGAGFWRRAHLDPNGDVIAIFEGLGIIKIDKDSNLLWASGVRAHHDLEILPNGDVLVLTREGRVIPRIDVQKPVLEDFVSVLDGGDGHEKQRISLLEAFEQSEFNAYWNPATRFFGDLFHTNTLELLDGSIEDTHPEFSAGRVLVSLLIPSTIAVIDLDTGRAVWAKQGDFVRQHDPKVLSNGRLMLFDNGGKRKFSRVIEFDPEYPDKPIWEYVGDEDSPFYSPSCGTAERLPNGNTLITESDGGRAFEVTPDQEIVWEFYNPHRAEGDDSLIATLFEVVRLSEDFPTAWIPGMGEGD